MWVVLVFRRDLLKDSDGSKYARAAFSTSRFRIGVRGVPTLSTTDAPPSAGMISARLVYRGCAAAAAVTVVGAAGAAADVAIVRNPRFGKANSVNCTVSNIELQTYEFTRCVTIFGAVDRTFKPSETLLRKRVLGQRSNKARSSCKTTN